MVASRHGIALDDSAQDRVLGGMRRLPPHPEVPDALSRLQEAGLRLVAAHAWDVTGALRAGCTGAFVARPGMVLDPTGEAPDVVGRDLTEVADRLLET